MEVLNEGKFKMLCNYEVSILLKEINDNMKKKESKGTKNENLSTILYEVEKYLTNTPCEYQNEDIIKQIMQDLKPFNLTKAEKLQIINQRPTTEVEIALIIEESEERLTEDQVNELISVIEKLPFPEDDDQDVQEVEQDEEMEEN